ncbi:uncharacterized protein IL334_000005 [Kwoniella shivajii]|uniref:MFS general substrate transporter n=1 Tax=Kwoniella shivajii TaxID=564305 RepID=A0ABZ1CS60_9TREE|nr:hypothetical protein IL334_000005 [Kwoniella shivajii]
MAELDTAPPNTRAGGNDDALRIKNIGHERVDGADEIDMVAYHNDVPRWKRIHQHSLTQMLLMSVQAFCGPAMGDALAGLGGGGLATPQTSNTATAISYTCLAITCFIGGPLVNRIGTKWALVFGAMSFPMRGASYYCNSKFGNQWFLILAAFITGTGSGCWYVAESGTIMTIAPSGARGKYLALWIVSRNLGQLIGGAINLSKNHTAGQTGGVTPDTYNPFMIIESLAFPFAWLITPLHNVVRSDGTRVRVAKRLPARDEFKLIKVTFTSKLILLSIVWAVWSFFYSGTWSTYLATYFSVRARALSSLISPFFCIVGCFGLGFILDMKGVTQRRTAQIGLFTVLILNTAVYVWTIIMQTKFNKSNPGKIDWADSLYPSAFLPYFFVQTTGPLSQSYMYWLLSSFATDAQTNVRNGAAFRCLEAVGQAISYGMNTKIKTSPLIGFCVTFALMGLTVVPTTILVNSTPDQIPADILDAEERVQEDHVDEKERGEEDVAVQVQRV